MMDWDEMADAQWDYDSLREYETERNYSATGAAGMKGFPSKAS